nr:ribosomal protein S19 [Coptis omeiensis]WGU50290.1 ribosomal protein S19 [Coptis deltoidea]WGU50308.1 ribosomal protein S19 [Coptis deltoidea]
MVDHKVEKWLELNAEKLLFVVSEGKVGHKFGEFASTRKRRPSRKNIGPGKKKGGKDKGKSKRIWHEKEIRYR